MDITKEYKNEIEKKIVECVLTSLENGSLKQQELCLIGEFVLARIDGIKIEQELVGFLEELTQKWPLFESLLILERGKKKDVQEDEVFRNVLAMAKGGKVEEAISLAKTMTST